MFSFLKKNWWVLLMAFIISCSQNRLVTDAGYLDEIEQSFNERKELAENRGKELFGIFGKGLSAEEETALQFLFAYMPLSDLADYSGEFFLAGVEKAIRARSEVPWGKTIPEDIFLHYVLPVRINNENLDSFRIAYFDEIHQRIKGKDLTEAALEINYWCQEKVSYQPADIRTSAPMSTILSARGRCGEESTFTVAALRTAGIPARQVYTPRWAHSDDNHAWVEIWIDGKWFYMGACEPEPVLDRGWFTEPARRAMLVHTKSFGAPWGNENIINTHRNFNEVNNLSKYAKTKEIFVKVEEQNGEAAADAMVEYKLYNYAEFYPIATIPADRNGVSSFETGLGSLLIWASKEGRFDWQEIDISETDTVWLRLENRKEEGSIDLDLMIPPVPEPLPGPSAEMLERNAERVNTGNLIRQTYINSWIKPSEAAAAGRKLGIPPDRARNILTRSMGNYREIMKFLAGTPDSLRDMAVTLLEVLADKDLRDTKAYVLDDHILNCTKSERLTSSNLFAEYILNPRIANEILADWRGYFLEKIPELFGGSELKDPGVFVRFLERNIRIIESENYYKTPITPRGVFDLRVSDMASRAICFVAMCRSVGIPSRLEPARTVPQYWRNNRWNDVFFADQENHGSAKAFVKITSNQTNPVPEYYIHFTLARFEKGRYNTLEYDYNRKATEFTNELELPAGDYMLVTGNRLDDRILSRLTFFELKGGEHITLRVETRTDTASPGTYGKIDLFRIADLLSQSGEIMQNSASKGAVVAWIEPGQEPTRHVFNDLPLLKKELDEWGGSFIFLTVSSDSEKTFNPGELKGLPEKSFFGTDAGMEAFRKHVNLDNEYNISQPFIIQCDSSGSIVFVSSGYRIGIGESILKNIQ